MNNPGAQLTHIDWPVWFWNEPGAHVLLTPAPSQYEPTGQGITPVLVCAEPPVEKEPTGTRSGGLELLGQ